MTAIRHTNTSQTSTVDEFVEPSGLTTRILYACPNLEVTHNLVQLNLGTPTVMRAPGENPCTFALESAMDELAYKLGIDPIELRLINHADMNHQTNKHGATVKAIAIENGRLFLRETPTMGETYAQILQRHQIPVLELEASANTASSETQEARNPTVRICGSKDENADQQQYAFQSFGAQFAEVQVNPRLGQVRVTRFVSAMDCGRILNPKTAQSQIRGGIIMGIGMALMEETVLDPQTGRLLVKNLADYHIPVHADIPQIDVLFTDIPDPHISPIGVRGVGEIGITGVAAAIANAIYHATGKRIRDLPITSEKLL